VAKKAGVLLVSALLGAGAALGAAACGEERGKVEFKGDTGATGTTGTTPTETSTDSR
jgi:hypothetical protein